MMALCGQNVFEFTRKHGLFGDSTSNLWSCTEGCIARAYVYRMIIQCNRMLKHIVTPHVSWMLEDKSSADPSDFELNTRESQ
jgi:hypothetical protein